MSNKRKFNLITFVMNVVLAAPALLGAFTNVLGLVQADARLAKRSLIRCVVLAIFGLTLLFSSWVCLLGIIYLSLISLHLSPILSLMIIFLINTLLLIIIGLVMMNVKDKIFFPRVTSLIRRS